MAEIENRAARIIDDKILIAMAAAAHCRAQTGTYNALQRLGRVGCGFAQFDAAGKICIRRRHTKVSALFQRLITRVLLGNGDCHVTSGSLLCSHSFYLLLLSRWHSIRTQLFVVKEWQFRCKRSNRFQPANFQESRRQVQWLCVLEERSPNGLCTRCSSAPNL